MKRYLTKAEKTGSKAGRPGTEVYQRSPVPRSCFVCDEAAGRDGVSLRFGLTSCSSTALPTKIGQLMGDNFMIVVTDADVLCKRCSALLNHLDKLEQDMGVVRKALTGYLKKKYHLSDDLQSAGDEEDDELTLSTLKQLDRSLDQNYKNLDLNDFNKENGVSGGRTENSKSVAEEFSTSERERRMDEKASRKLSTGEFSDSINRKGEKRPQIDEMTVKRVKVAKSSSDDVTIYRCMSCSFRSPRMDQFMQHLKVHPKKTYYKCSECSKHFENKEDARNHIESVHKFSDAEYEDDFQEDIDEPETKKLYECATCGYEDSDKEEYENHLQSHEPVKFHECKICAKKFRSKQFLQKHVANHRLFKCGVCGKIFKIKSDLLLHFRVHKSDRKPASEGVGSDIHKSLSAGGSEPAAKSNGTETPKTQLREDYDKVEQMLEIMHSEAPKLHVDDQKDLEGEKLYEQNDECNTWDETTTDQNWDIANDSANRVESEEIAETQNKFEDKVAVRTIDIIEDKIDMSAAAVAVNTEEEQEQEQEEAEATENDVKDKHSDTTSLPPTIDNEDDESQLQAEGSSATEDAIDDSMTDGIDHLSGMKLSEILTNKTDIMCGEIKMQCTNKSSLPFQVDVVADDTEKLEGESTHKLPMQETSVRIHNSPLKENPENMLIPEKKETSEDNVEISSEDINKHFLTVASEKNTKLLEFPSFESTEVSATEEKFNFIEVPATEENLECIEVTEAEENLECIEVTEAEENLECLEVPETEENLHCIEFPDTNENLESIEVFSVEENIEYINSRATEENFQCIEVPATEENLQCIEVPATEENLNCLEVSETEENLQCIEVPATEENLNCLEFSETEENLQCIEVSETEDLQCIEVPATEENLECVEIPETEENLESIEVSITEDKYEYTEDNFDSTEEKIDYTDEIFDSTEENFYSAVEHFEEYSECIEVSGTEEDNEFFPISLAEKNLELKINVKDDYMPTLEESFKENKYVDWQDTYTENGFESSQHSCVEGSPKVRKSPENVFVCSVCGLENDSESKLKRHYKTHVVIENKFYECHICKQLLQTEGALEEHLSQHSLGEKHVQCTLCSEKFEDSFYLQQHMEEKHSFSHQCSYCDEVFPNKKLLLRHEKTHPERLCFKCDRCEDAFETEIKLKTHLANVHGDTSYKLGSATIFKCDQCGKVLTSQYYLKKHILNQHTFSSVFKCIVCSVTFSEQWQLRQHTLDQHPVDIRCTYCKSAFANEEACRQHEETHHNVPFVCEACGRGFASQTVLDKHEVEMHRDEPNCKICSKFIPDPLKLYNHERRHSKSNQMFVCAICSRSFKTRSGVSHHMSLHTGKYPYYCELCGKGVHSPMLLEEHRASHTKEIRHICDLCGRMFSSSSTYRMHRVWHDNPLPYKCDICGQRFKHTSILSVHKRRSHTGERPYKCPYCPYTFAVGSTMKKHIILHTKQFPFVCEHCSKGFTTRLKLVNHNKSIHKDFSGPPLKRHCEYKMVLRPDELKKVKTEK
ncbi:uncharacterized protein LOC134540893 isoform X2 [Bacillus rossius redtenbacheri]|uniref:uncharacterized protein LOC134540893 isoform X2 n=2 Tax=Bacillus rossius redtenbacheri TaxID=93214 RepID=UPI002FDD16AB